MDLFNKTITIDQFQRLFEILTARLLPEYVLDKMMRREDFSGKELVNHVINELTKLYPQLTTIKRNKRFRNQCAQVFGMGTAPIDKRNKLVKSMEGCFVSKIDMFKDVVKDWAESPKTNDDIAMKLKALTLEDKGVIPDSEL